jgi:hypothetical protein
VNLTTGNLNERTPVTTTGWIIICALLCVALFAMWCWAADQRAKRDVALARLEESENSLAHHKEMEEAEEARADGLLEEKLAWVKERGELRGREHALASRNAMLEAQLAQRKLPPRPARFALEGGMSEEMIGQLLRGTEKLPQVRAIVALLSAEIVLLSDRATDAPREAVQLPDRTIAPYTEQMRLHDAGGASHVARILARVQELAVARDEPKQEAAA